MIKICSLARLNDTVSGCRAQHVVTLVRDEARVFRPEGINPDNHLWLQMDDIADPIDDLEARLVDQPMELRRPAAAFGERNGVDFDDCEGAARESRPIVLEQVEFRSFDIDDQRVSRRQSVLPENGPETRSRHQCRGFAP